MAVHPILVHLFRRVLLTLLALLTVLLGLAQRRLLLQLPCCWSGFWPSRPTLVLLGLALAALAVLAVGGILLVLVVLVLLILVLLLVLLLLLLLELLQPLLHVFPVAASYRPTHAASSPTRRTSAPAPTA